MDVLTFCMIYLLLVSAPKQRIQTLTEPLEVLQPPKIDVTMLDMCVDVRNDWEHTASTMHMETHFTHRLSCCLSAHRLSDGNR